MITSLSHFLVAHFGFWFPFWLWKSVMDYGFLVGDSGRRFGQRLWILIMEKDDEKSLDKTIKLVYS